MSATITAPGTRQARTGSKPSIPEVIERFARYHHRNPLWGSLYGVLVAEDVSDEGVRACIEQADEDGDIEGGALGRLLLRMSRTQRRKLGWMV